MKVDWNDNLPFVTVPNKRRTNMIIGEVVEELIHIKSKYSIGYPYDEAINNACNILDQLPRHMNVDDWIEENK